MPTWDRPDVYVFWKKTRSPGCSALRLTGVPALTWLQVPVPMFFQHIQDGTFHPTEPVASGTTALLDDLHKWAVALKVLRAEEEAEAARTQAA